MMIETGQILATFTAPENIGTQPQTLLYMFPLLLAAAIVYKATKMRVLFLGKFFMEVLILFGSISAVMILAAVALNIIVRIMTG